MGSINFYQEDPDKKKIQSFMNWIIDITLVVVLAVFVVQNMGIRIEVEGRSMEPELQSGDMVLVNQIHYLFWDPNRFDVIAFRKEEVSSKIYIKRIVGLPGETVQIIDGGLYIDGEAMVVAGMSEITLPGLAEEPVQLGQNEYFVLGDSADTSEDSRFSNIGNVTKDQFVGKVWLRAAPLDRIGLVRYQN